jgi:hypothetical protein
MPAGAAAAEALETRDFSEGDLSLYADFKHPQGWDRRLVRRFMERVFTKHPAVAAIRRREVPIFTSNHAPFFALARGPVLDAMQIFGKRTERPGGIADPAAFR